MDFLEEKNPATRSELARLPGVEPRTAYRILSLLTRKGLVLAESTTRNRVCRLKKS